MEGFNVEPEESDAECVPLLCGWVQITTEKYGKASCERKRCFLLII